MLKPSFFITLNALFLLLSFLSIGSTINGALLYEPHDWGAKGRTNAIGALIGATLLTVSVFESTINSEVFTAWVPQGLIPKLPQRSVVVMNNATFPKQPKMQDALDVNCLAL